MTNLLPRREDIFFPLQQQFDKLFDELFGPKRLPSFLNSVKSRSGYPKLDVLVTDGMYRIEVAVPGVEPDDLKVEIVPEQEAPIFGIDVSHHRLLRLTGRMSHDYQYSNNTDYHYRELTRAKFQRVIRLPDEVRGDPEAVIRNGMLTLTWKLEKPLDEGEAKLISIKKE
jgi:HSP20 family molecular chaperone IbpA